MAMAMVRLALALACAVLVVRGFTMVPYGMLENEARKDNRRGRIVEGVGPDEGTPESQPPNGAHGTSRQAQNADATQGVRSIRTLVATEVAPTHIWQFEFLLAPSWQRLAISTIGTVGGVVPDLFVACEPGACEAVRTMGCTFVPGSGYDEHEMRTFGLDEEDFGNPLREAQCYYAKTAGMPAHKKAKTARFVQSLRFLHEKPFRDLIGLGAHDYVLRVDADSVLLPGLLWLYPANHDGWFGRGFEGVPITFHTIERFAKTNMGYSEVVPNAFRDRINMQSSFYVRADLVLPFAERILESIRALNTYGFTEEFCHDLESSKAAAELAPNKSNLCRWPYWSRDVSTLYATTIAANTMIKRAIVTDMLDAASAPIALNYETRANFVIQAHLIQQKFVLFQEVLQAKETLCADVMLFIQEVLVDHKRKRVRVIFEAYSAENPDAESIYYHIADVFISAVTDRYCPSYESSLSTLHVKSPEHRRLPLRT